MTPPSMLAATVFGWRCSLLILVPVSVYRSPLR